MELKQKAQKAVGAIGEIVGGDLSAGQKEALDKVIEDLLVSALQDCTTTYRQAANACCSEDQDMAHKIAREMDSAREALIANLSSLR